MQNVLGGCDKLLAFGKQRARSQCLQISREGWKVTIFPGTVVGNEPLAGLSPSGRVISSQVPSRCGLASLTAALCNGVCTDTLNLHLHRRKLIIGSVYWAFLGPRIFMTKLGSQQELRHQAEFMEQLVTIE